MTISFWGHIGPKLKASKSSYNETETGGWNLKEILFYFIIQLPSPKGPLGAFEMSGGEVDSSPAFQILLLKEKIKKQCWRLFFSRVDFSSEDGGTLSKNNYKPSQHLWRTISVQRLARSFSTNRQIDILLLLYII